MTDLKAKLPSWVTPQIAISFANFLAIVFTAGSIYASDQGDKARIRQDISDLKMEMRQVRLQDTSIAVLKSDVASIKESVVRIEGRVERLSPAPSMPLPRIQQ